MESIENPQVSRKRPAPMPQALAAFIQQQIKHNYKNESFTAQKTNNIKLQRIKQGNKINVLDGHSFSTHKAIVNKRKASLSSGRVKDGSLRGRRDRSKDKNSKRKSQKTRVRQNSWNEQCLNSIKSRQTRTLPILNNNDEAYSRGMDDKNEGKSLTKDKLHKKSWSHGVSEITAKVSRTIVGSLIKHREKDKVSSQFREKRGQFSQSSSGDLNVLNKKKQTCVSVKSKSNPDLMESQENYKRDRGRRKRRDVDEGEVDFSLNNNLENTQHIKRTSIRQKRNSPEDNSTLEQFQFELPLHEMNNSISIEGKLFQNPEIPLETCSELQNALISPVRRKRQRNNDKTIGDVQGTANKACTTEISHIGRVSQNIDEEVSIAQNYTSESQFPKRRSRNMKEEKKDPLNFTTESSLRRRRSRNMDEQTIIPTNSTTKSFLIKRRSRNIDVEKNDATYSKVASCLIRGISQNLDEEMNDYPNSTKESSVIRNMNDIMNEPLNSESKFSHIRRRSRTVVEEIDDPINCSNKSCLIGRTSPGMKEETSKSHNCSNINHLKQIYPQETAKSKYEAITRNEDVNYSFNHKNKLDRIGTITDPETTSHNSFITKEDTFETIAKETMVDEVERYKKSFKSNDVKGKILEVHTDKNNTLCNEKTSLNQIQKRDLGTTDREILFEDRNLITSTLSGVFSQDPEDMPSDEEYVTVRTQQSVSNNSNDTDISEDFVFLYDTSMNEDLSINNTCIDDSSRYGDKESFFKVENCPGRVTMHVYLEDNKEHKADCQLSFNAAIELHSLCECIDVHELRNNESTNIEVKNWKSNWRKRSKEIVVKEIKNNNSENTQMKTIEFIDEPSKTTRKKKGDERIETDTERNKYNENKAHKETQLLLKEATESTNLDSGQIVVSGEPFWDQNTELQEVIGDIAFENQLLIDKSNKSFTNKDMSMVQRYMEATEDSNKIDLNLKNNELQGQKFYIVEDKDETQFSRRRRRTRRKSTKSWNVVDGYYVNREGSLLPFEKSARHGTYKRTRCGTPWRKQKQQTEENVQNTSEERKESHFNATIIKELGSSSYGSRYSSTGTSGSTTASSYLSGLKRDRSSSRDGSGYGSDYSRTGYGSGSGSTSYSSRFSSDTSRGFGISALASKFGETKSSRRESLTSTGTSTASAGIPPKPTNTYTSSRSTRDLNSSSAQAREPTTSTYTSRTRASDYSSPRSADLVTTDSASRIRTRTRELPLNSSSQDTTSVRPSLSSYSSRYGTGSSYDRSGYNSDAKSGYGSDYSKSGYGSGYGSGTDTYKRYSWSRSNSFIKDADRPTTPASNYRLYNRQNSYLSTETGTTSVPWRSRFQVTEKDSYQPPPKTTTLKTDNEPKESIKLTEGINSKEQRPTAFQTAIGKLTQGSKENCSKEDKKPDHLSPNAVKVLPSFALDEVKLKTKAPADFSSDSEDSDTKADDDQEKKNVKGAATSEKKIEKVKTVTDEETAENINIRQPSKHLCTSPSLLSRRTDSTSERMLSAPTVKYSNEIASSTSKVINDNENANRSPSPRNYNETNLNINKLPHKLSQLPPRSPVSERKKDKSSPQPEVSNSGSHKDATIDISNKDYRKSVLNMDIQAEDQEMIRRHQEEKREELRRLRRQNVTEHKIRSPELERKDVVTDAEKANFVQETKQHNTNISESLEEEEKKEDKPPTVPSAERTPSRSKIVEKRHSIGRSDSLRKSSSFRRRERHSSQNSRTPSTSSSDSESESKCSRVKNNSYTRVRKIRSRDDAVAKTASRERLIEARRSRQNSESLTKVNSKSNLTKSGNNSRNLSDRSNNNSKSSILGEKKLAIGPDIDIGENTTGNVTNCVHKSGSKTSSVSRTTSRGDPIKNGRVESHKLYKKQRKEILTSSSSSSSETSDDSSDSAGEEGCLFSISKSRSIKKSKSALNKLNKSFSSNIPHELGDRTSPDGREAVSRSSSAKNLQNENTLPEVDTLKYIDNKKQEDLSDKSVNVKLNNYELPDRSHTNSKSNIHSGKSSNVDNNTDYDVSEMPEYDIGDALSKSSSKQNVNDTNQTTYEPFEWPPGSPVLVRKKFNEIAQETEQEVDHGEYKENSSTVNTQQDPETDVKEELSEFEWPDGSPVTTRKKHYIRTQWDTDTETEATQNEWSDGSPEVSKMPKVAEETEDEIDFQWPSSPEYSRRNTICGTEQDNNGFEWPSSPELPEMKNPKFISFTTDIDNLLNDGRTQDSFVDMEKELGLVPVESENTKAEAIRAEEERKEKDREEAEREKEKEKEEESKANKYSLRSRARRNLSLFVDTLSNIDEILGSVLRPLSSRQNAKTEEPSIQEIDASQVKVHDAQENRAEIDENIEEIDASAVIVREKRESLKAEIIKAVKEGVSKLF